MMMPELQVCDHPALLSKRAASVIAQKGAANKLRHCSRKLPLITCYGSAAKVRCM